MSPAGPMRRTVAHAIEPREVRRGLCRVHDVVGRHREAQCGKRDFANLRTEFLSAAIAIASRSERLGANPREATSFGRPTTTPRKSVRACRQCHRRLRRVVASVRVVSRNGSQHLGCIGNLFAKHRNAIEGRPERHQSVATHSSIGRLDAHHSAEGRGLPHRSARLGTKRRGHHAGRHQCCRTTARSPGPAPRNQRMHPPPKCGMFRR